MHIDEPRQLEVDLPDILVLNELRSSFIGMGESATEGLATALLYTILREEDSDVLELGKNVPGWVGTSFVDHKSQDVVSEAISLLALSSERWGRSAGESLKSLLSGGKFFGRKPEDGGATIKEDPLGRLKEALAQNIERKLLRERGYYCDRDELEPSNALVAPYLQYARCVRAMNRSKRGVLSPGYVFALFAVTQELYRVSESIGSFGSARASDSVMPTAFVTSECCRAILGLSKMCSATAELLRHCRELLEYKEHFALMETVEDKAAKKKRVSREWINGEVERIALSKYISMQDSLRRSLLPENVMDGGPPKSLDECRDLVARILDETSAMCTRSGSSAREFLDDYVDGAKARTKRLQGDAKKERERAKRAADEMGLKGKVTLEKRADRFDPTWAGYTRARSSIASVAIYADEVATAAREASQVMRVDGNNGGFLEKIDQAIDALQSAHDEIVELVEPSTRFFSGCVERELARGRTGADTGVSLHELAYASAALFALNPDAGKSMSSEVASELTQSLSNEGHLPGSAPVDLSRTGYQLSILHFEALRALAEFLRSQKTAIPTETVQKLLEGFSIHGKRRPDNGGLFGWGVSGLASKSTAAPWPTAVALVAIDRLVDFLDERINRRVLRHFNASDKTHSRPRLNGLLYPDHGLSGLQKTVGLEEKGGGKRSSCTQDVSEHLPAESKNLGELFQVLRAHVMGINVPGKSGCSVVLYGPPGTGKTTYFEALAASARCNLVEISPSDIVVAGEAAIEKRSRDAMHALSLLRGCVVLFDEFEPVVRNRRLGGDSNSPVSTFSFLTAGMLPKLKRLNENASESRTVFGLVTNQIGMIDDAAIRPGRFDFRVPVFPPTRMSRMGRLMDRIMWIRQSECGGSREGLESSGLLEQLCSKTFRDRVAEIVSHTRLVPISGMIRITPFLSAKHNQHKAVGGGVWRALFSDEGGKARAEALDQVRLLAKEQRLPKNSVLFAQIALLGKGSTSHASGDGEDGPGVEDVLRDGRGIQKLMVDELVVWQALVANEDQFTSI